MPFLDRYWWLRIPIALLPLGAVLFLIAYILSNPLGAMRDPLLGSGCTGVGALALLVVAYFLMVRIGPARNRLGRRHAAIAGNQGAIPPAYGAEILAETALPTIPFTVAFPLTRWDQPARARLRVILSLPLFAIALVLTFFLESQGNRTPPLVIGSVVLYVLGAITHLWTTIITRPYIRTYHTPRHIAADTMGILWQPIVGRERAIRWDEMRLLEVMSFNATPFTSNQAIERRRYTLYTENSAIWWVDPGNLHLPPSGPYAQLLALIKARTGLDPRTFDTHLLAPAFLQATGELPAPAPSLERNVAYLLAFPLPSRRGRLVAAFIGLLLTSLAILAGIWTLSKFDVVTLPPLLAAATSWLHAIPAFFLLLGGIIGLPLLIGALHATPARCLRRRGGIRANQSGLSDYPSRKGTLIAWSDIADIQCETLGTAKTYIVRSAIVDAKIVWPDIPGDRYPPTTLITALGFTPISSDELVSLVMHMTRVSRSPRVTHSHPYLEQHMPFLDRHWWLRVLFACGASAVAVAYVVWSVRTALSIPPDSPVHPGPAVVVFAILIPQLLFLTARYMIRIALPSRKRARLAAIRGNREAVPASLIVPHPERAPDVTAEPLVIAWRPFTFRRSETAPAWAVLILGVLLLLLITFFMSVGDAMTSYHTFPEIVLHTALSALLFSALAIAFLLGVTIIGVVFSGVWSVGIASPIIAFFGKPFDVAANAEGITTHNLWGRTHHVRWDDARLLEVSIAPPVLGHYRVFTLYGQDSYVCWRDDTGSIVNAPTQLDGITREEGSKRLQALFDLIAARTGLAPRTFDGALAADRSNNLPRLLRRSLRMLPPTLACATLAIVSSQFPLTNAAMLNGVTSAAYFILTAGCLIFMLTYRRRSPAAARQRTLADVDEALASQATLQACAVYTSTPRSQILTVFFASLLACLAALSLLFAWFGTFDIPAFHVFRAIQFSPLWPSQAAAMLVGFFGVVGLLVLVLAIASFFAKPVTLDVQADAEGLRDRGGIKDEFLSWDAIDSITRSADVDGEVRYTVVGSYARNTITWSTTYALPANPGLPLPAVTPGQLAAIVVARSGKPLTLR